MRKISCLLVFIIIMGISFYSTDSFAVKQVRVELSDRTEISKLYELNLDIAYIDREKPQVDIIADETDMDKIQGAGLAYEIIHEDVSEFYRSRYGEILTMGGYPTMEEAYDSLDLYHSLYPELLTERDSIGYTIQGRPIYYLKLSDNPMVDEDEPEILINGLIHAREPGSLLFNLYYIRYLLDNYYFDPEIQDLVDNREFYFIPLINPDGYEFNRINDPNGGGMWRKNLRDNGGGSYGVDLNRNWGYLWGYDDEGSSPWPDDPTYRGTAPFSEPETQCVREFINSREFITALNYHSYSGLCLYSYGYEVGAYPEDLQLFRAMGDTMTSVNGYSSGTGWETLYVVNGDATDWQYGERDEKPKIFSFVIEIGWQSDGFWPPLYRIPQLNEENLDLALILSDLSDNPFKVLTPNPPTIYPLGQMEDNSYTVAWNHEDDRNPAVAFELVEKTEYRRLIEGFENGTDRWYIDDWIVRDYKWYSGVYSLFSGVGNDAYNTATAIEPVRAHAGDTLSFYTWYDIEEDWDYAYVQVSTDNGVTFDNLEGNITTNYNPNGGNAGNGITGSTNNYWVEAKFPLDDYAGQQLLVRMLYDTDSWIYGEGMYIDEFFPLDTYLNSQVLSSDITDTAYFVENREDGVYYYQVRAKDADDQWGYYSSIEYALVGQTSVDDAEEVPYGFILFNNYPNPFNAGTNIDFAIPEAGKVKLEVLNLMGQRVITLVDEKVKQGRHTVNWDGRDSSGNQVSSGFYMYRLQTGNQSVVKRMLLLK